MEFDDLQRNWDAFGKTDPLWAVLTSPGKRHNRWDVKEFFATGEKEVSRVLAHVDRLGWPLERGRALDFGCGVGRLTQALAGHFALCEGVDIAPSMIKRARRHNRKGRRCRFLLNEHDDLRLFADGSFDFVYSAHVLQHMAPRYSRRYLEEFVRVLRPGGLMFFQLTTEPIIGATDAMPEDAFQAAVDIGAQSLRVRAGARVPVPVRVGNRSMQMWPAAGKDGWYQVMVGNHWLDGEGDRLLKDDARAPLPRDVAPGEAAVVELDVRAPAAPGAYVLEVDLVQEGVAWFGERGSTTAQVPVEVRPPRRRNPWRRWAAEELSLTDDEPTMEMYGVSRDEVHRWIEEAGGQLVDVFEWSRISDEESHDWRRYCFVGTQVRSPR